MNEGAPGGFPCARSDLLTEEIEAETVVYDGLSGNAHCLRPVAAAVFAGSDGRTSLAELAAIASSRLGEPVEVELVEHALAELEERGLLVAETGGDGISRRHFVRKTALVGGAVWATPLVLSSPAFAQTTCGTCTNCPDGRLFGIRIEEFQGGCRCDAVNDPCPDATTGASLDCGEGSNGCCLIPTHVQWTCQETGGQLTSVTFDLAPGVQFCGASGTGGGECTGDAYTTAPSPVFAGGTRVVVTKSNLSHADIVVCVPGSPPPPCTGT